MKRLWIAVSILSVIFAATLFNSWYLDKLIENCTLRLSTAQDMTHQNAWSSATQLTEQVIQDWQDHDFYFHVMLPHKDIDEIHLTFCEVQEYLQLEETDQYTAANAKLVAQLELLAEMDQLTLKNIL